MPDASPRRAAPQAGHETRDRIIAVALTAFAELGFDGATTREIAARAGVNVGLIKYYFEGKLGLWQAAVGRAFAQMRAGIEDQLGELALHAPNAWPPDGELDRFRLLLRGCVRTVGRHPEFVRMMHEEGKRGGPRLDWLVEHHVRPFYSTLAHIRERLAELGVLPEAMTTVHFYYVLAGAIAVIFHQAEECRRVADLDPADPAVIEAHADAVESLLLGRAAGASSRP